MPDRDSVLAAVAGDPLALYPALAALLLASVALASGLMRGDALALARPAPVVALLAALAAAYGVLVVAGTAPVAWQAEVLGGVARLPLYLVALAYGAVPALVAAALAGAYLPPVSGEAWASAHLGLELVVLGWLAIAPSPRRRAVVAGVYALLAYVLAAATVGVAAQALGGSAVDLAALAERHGRTPLGVAAVAVLLALLSPRRFDALFPGSRIAPRAARTDAPDEPSREEPRALGAGAAPLPAPAIPPAFERPPRRRERPEPIELRVDPLGRRRGRRG